jgi:hypothetical protein
MMSDHDGPRRRTVKIAAAILYLAFTKRDRSRFLGALDTALQAALREAAYS